MNSKYISFFSM